ncbi:MAG: hypothetical protein ABI824_09140 [Acidobacteriota bacterium]
MTPPNGSRLPVLSPGRVFVPADPNRRLECFLIDVSPNGFELHTQFPLPVEELVAAEIEDHLVLADVKTCELRSGKFQIGLERLYAVPLTRLNHQSAVDPEAKLRIVLRGFLEDGFPESLVDGPESRRVLEQARLALEKLSRQTTATPRAVPRIEGGASSSHRLALVRELQASTPNPIVSVDQTADLQATPAGVVIGDGKTLPSLLLSPETAPPETAPIDPLVPDGLALDAPVPMASAPPNTEPEEHLIRQSEPEPTHEPIRLKFSYAHNDSSNNHVSRHLVPTPGWLYNFVPAPLTPLTPELRDLAKNAIESLDTH